MEGWCPALQLWDVGQFSVEHIDLQPDHGLQHSSSARLELNVGRVEFPVRLQLRVRLELGQESGVGLVEVREGNVLGSPASTGRDIEQSAGEGAVRVRPQGPRGLVKVVREEVGVGVVAPGSLAVARVGQLFSIQPVVVLPAQAEAQRPAEVRGEVGDGGGGGVGGGEGSLYTP